MCLRNKVKKNEEIKRKIGNQPNWFASKNLFKNEIDLIDLDSKLTTINYTLFSLLIGCLQTSPYLIIKKLLFTFPPSDH